MKTIVPILLFSLSCNLDTLLLGVNCAMRLGTALIIAALTSTVAGAALLLGEVAGRLIAGAATLGALALIAIGLWTAWDGLRRPGKVGADDRKSGTAIGIAMAINDSTAGVAAGAGGLNPAAGAAINFVVTLTMLWLGGCLARRLRGSRLGRLVMPASGALLALLGALSLLRR